MELVSGIVGGAVLAFAALCMLIYIAPGFAVIVSLLLAFTLPFLGVPLLFMSVLALVAKERNS